MKAIVYRNYGAPDVLRYEEREKPVPGDNEVLIKVRAASVNPYDWHFMRGEPYPLRLVAGLRAPKDHRLGADVAGEVEAVGKNITQLKPGDAVFGTCRGALAEYACSSESRLAPKPEGVTFEQAASVGIAAITALQALRDKGHIQPGQNVLVNGAAGGVGTFGVQIAKTFDANVTGVCSAKNLDTVQSIGADHVIDYTSEDYTRSRQSYDIILDCVGNHSLSINRTVLSPKGIYVGAGGQGGRWMIDTLAGMIAAPLMSWFGGRKLVSLLANINREDLTIVGELIASGKVTPVIDRRYTLSETADAIRYLEGGHARGKVVIILDGKP
ncbi:MAG TPA: NAD(P)-dependent alcohol dehydrogenase [Candidatus Dormibacteraeota bacterium]|nr:NAD(P)-dependent alcohol dehydrogenase [Candidatus Dormibacteraeota bacterium]